MSGIDLVLVWHMHQPDYRDTATGEFRLPWVYLHALKDYTDMAWHLEQHPRMRAVVNFVPVLLDQLEDYADQLATGRLRDPLLRLLARPADRPLTEAERDHAIDQCFHANHHQMIAPFPAYRRLWELAKQVEGYGRGAVGYLSERYVDDLVTWYHLSWTGESVRRESTLVTGMMAQAEGFTPAQRHALLDLIRELIVGLVPRYRRLEEAGTIELSTTPEQHPLAPLLIDFGSARDARPDLPLPQSTGYPGGLQRAEWHVRTAAGSHARRFGRAPTGMWPAEGAVSDATVRLAAQAGMRWVASGEQVLANSLARAGALPPERAQFLYRAWKLPSMARGATCFFRDDRLSDLIGFEYRKWDGGHAAAHFTAELEAIANAATAGERPVVSVILDGENAWDHYPYNGHYFLAGLYDRVSDHPVIRPCTYREWLAERPPGPDGAAIDAKPLAGLVAGSWVYGDLTTWIGSHDKNAAWDLLVTAKQAYDLVVGSGRLAPDAAARAAHQLSICESSDWFWWFGDYNPARAVASFDRLYRANLAALYRLLALTPPASLDEPVSHGSAAADFDGAMRRATEV